MTERNVVTVRIYFDENNQTRNSLIAEIKRLPRVYSVVEASQ